MIPEVNAKAVTRTSLLLVSKVANYMAESASGQDEANPLF